MSMYETSDLHKRVERYEAALEELRGAHHDIKNILHDQVLYERWQQIGTDLGFTSLAGQYQSGGAQSSAAQSSAAQLAGGLLPGSQSPVAGAQHDLNGHQIPQMAESWAS